MKQNNYNVDTKVIVIVPTYNNPLTIKDVAADVLSYNYNLIIIDDGSDIEIETLFSAEEKENIIFVRHPQNIGKGAAIVSGTKKAKELNYTHVLSIDGDGQHLASQAYKLIDAIDTPNEIIIGSRNFDLDNVPNASKFGRWFSNMWATWDTGYDIQDSLSGYRIYPISILDLEIKTVKFDWEMEVIVRHADKGDSIKEIIIECFYPLAELRVSHFNKFKDTSSIVWVHLQILPLKWLKFMNPFSK